MSAHSFVDCNGLAGFMSLGFVKSGMDMVARTGTLDFGNVVAEQNRHLLGNDWASEFSSDSNEWPTHDVDAVVGCPPCSGWSVWSGADKRGPDAAAHEHTRAFMRYVANVKPKVAVFECVQQAYTQGRDVMVMYRDMVEELSGKSYDLYHVKHNNLQVGGFSFRQRYFWVAVESGMQFGAEAVWPSSVPTVMDVIGDLQDLEIKWDRQSYSSNTASDYVNGLRNSDGTVDGHMVKVSSSQRQVSDIFDILGNEGWEPRMTADIALKRAVEKNGDKFPQAWSRNEEKIRAKNFDIGYSIAGRWDSKSFSNVLTGAALDHVVHPTLPRLITHREAARIQGLPDSWKFANVNGYSQLPAIWGKAVAVQAANWIGNAVVSALDGQPAGPQGELIGDREWLLDTDSGFTRNAVKRRYIETE